MWRAYMLKRMRLIVCHVMVALDCHKLASIAFAGTVYLTCKPYLNGCRSQLSRP